MYELKKTNNGVCASKGFFADGISIGLKPENQKDMAFIYSQNMCEIASVFTSNKMLASPIKHFKNKKDFKTNFILINAKNANAMTGKNGIDDIDDILCNLQNNSKVKIENPVMSSTGVIGVRLPKEKIISGLQKLDLSKKNSDSASEAIMTTDAFAKTISYEVELKSGEIFNIGAIAKGAGMINPAMATMLCFITTDAKIDKQEMQELLDESVKTSFNAISVDGDTSTNDTILLLSNAKSGVYQKDGFRDALGKIMKYLALEIVRDGEGATKIVSYKISGAKNDKEAEIVAKALSNSLLMKTALFGEDPNWGRVASTIGASGVQSNEESLKISFDSICVYDSGKFNFDQALEEKASLVMKKEKFSIICDLGISNGSFTAYGCDLGYKYIDINADYRT